MRRYRDREGHWGLAVGRPLRPLCAPLRDAERELRSDDYPLRAWHYRQYTPNEAEYRRLRRQARGADRGLWSQAGPTPPWEWQDRQSDSSNKATAQAALETHRWKTETAWTPTPGRKRSASSNGISLMTRTAQMQTEMVQTEVVGLASLFPACLRAARATVASNRIGMPSRQPGWPLEFGPSLAMGSASGELPARPSWLNPIGSTQLAEKQKGRTTLGTEVQTTNPTSTSRRMLSPRRWEPCG